MLLFSSAPGKTVSRSFLDEKTEKKVLKTFKFESPDKGVEVPDEFANDLIKTYPNVFGTKSFKEEAAEFKAEQKEEAKLAKAKADAEAKAKLEAEAKIKLDAKEEAKKNR